MDMYPVLPVPQSGTFYEYAPKMMAFEFNGFSSKKTLVFIGGLGDGFATLPYLPALSTSLNKIGWSVVQIYIRSSYIGWGSGSLKRDAEDISQLVSFLRSEAGGKREKIVIMGHSTGCQDTMQYASKFEQKSSTKANGYILQAGASDREAALGVGIPLEELEKSVELAKTMIAAGRENEIMPYEYCSSFLDCPISAYRWNALYSVRGDDDFFSTYLTPEDHAKTWGKVNEPILVVFSGSDEFVPKSVDKVKLLDDWKSATDSKYWSPLSKPVPGARHNVGVGSEKGALEDLVATVTKFLEDTF
ncbi:unnamed protein product [Kuraishia capsulata CBS 1993]|uniref:Uncharacterized protein n=1 Tax=Kuraishia capsulata CBS 1993 TaxID=1382522 RepID=W6MNH3_9ASCO|nr:uncharacterized protein KUCA_T00004196001 [Kuraishia capsulata CBS 1993]CDK28214.1 unnamed protein product [Kuraishia capsulata CBS 1993]